MTFLKYHDPMKNLCILSDFDGTITSKDAIYNFISTYAQEGWQEVEELWVERKIGSEECLEKEFELIPNLSEALIDEFLKTIEIDEGFRAFYEFTLKNNIDFYVVSDGIDYFINRIFELHNIKNVKIISNHGEFKNGLFEFSFPNKIKNCINNLGTCKCSVLKEMKKTYKKVIFIGDGVSDFCIAGKADFLWAKSSLIKYCEKNNIKHSKFQNFSEIKISQPVF